MTNKTHLQLFLIVTRDRGILIIKVNTKVDNIIIFSNNNNIKSQLKLTVYITYKTAHAPN